MESTNLFISSVFCCFLLISGYVAAAQDVPHHHHHLRGEKHEINDEYASRPSKLFVFGDSYADTGNVRKSLGNSWNEPYGTTFPGKPAGRFSDGRILTDYIANYLGLKTPLAYTWLQKLGGKKLDNGMNFAYGGSGVFNTLGDLLPNITTQISFLDKLINDSVFTTSDLHSSLVLVSLVGNDYSAYLAQGGSEQGLPSFVPLVINQLGSSLKRIQEMGATKVIVTGLQPVGCLPRITISSSFQQCNSTQNSIASHHNLLLQQTVDKLNNETKSNTFLMLDLYSSFTTVLAQKGSKAGDLKFESPLKPCCTGISSAYFCGSVDDKGVKMYTVCSDPKSAFFWDNSHPTEAGWRAVYTTLKSSLGQFFQF